MAVSCLTTQHKSHRESIALLEASLLPQTGFSAATISLMESYSFSASGSFILAPQNFLRFVTLSVFIEERRALKILILFQVPFIHNVARFWWKSSGAYCSSFSWLWIVANNFFKIPTSGYPPLSFHFSDLFQLLCCLFHWVRLPISKNYKLYELIWWKQR